MNAPLSPALDALGEHSVGAILAAAGRLRADEQEQILRRQRDTGLRFGEAAVELGLLTERDVGFAMARQFDYPVLQRGDSKVSMSVVAAYDPFSLQSEALRAVRSQLMLRWFDPAAGRKALAVVSPQEGEGRSWMAANLAVAFSQLGQRTLLIDADLRRPTLHRLFGLDGRNGLSALLLGRQVPDAIRGVPELRSLAILPAGAVPPNPQELLARPLFGQLMRQYAAGFDVVIVDTSPGEACADGLMVAARVRGVLMVARRNASRLAAVRRYAERLREAGAVLAGAVVSGD
ncbi:chain length determinant protein tyrosine kinase EpsG [Azoarcus sp. KH32C]|uniref:chain length determinant protein tyrosine kinase EpsG n=1 Tax=Azoarcus sp. KH32C TaxID=748247 RepID=UPI0002386B10|nr:chain length determinant protein tyrosine kinase EpsG [Azoarcus sp. KH32C]BAL23276.1 putative polysaccharide export protein [Azoarcus sp. KH32C]